MTRHSDAGFSLVELLVSMILVLVVFSGVTNAINKLSQAQRSIWNRTELHSGVRGATELLQQEVGQAGRITLPAPVTLTTATNTTGSINPVSLTASVSSTTGMFVGIQLVIDAGDKIETVAVTALDTSANTITGVFAGAQTTPSVPRCRRRAVSRRASSAGHDERLDRESVETLRRHQRRWQLVYVDTCDTTSGNMPQRDAVERRE